MAVVKLDELHGIRPERYVTQDFIMCFTVKRPGLS